MEMEEDASLWTARRKKGRHKTWIIAKDCAGMPSLDAGMASSCLSFRSALCGELCLGVEYRDAAEYYSSAKGVKQAE